MILSIIFVILFLSILILFFIPKTNTIFLKKFSLAVSGFILFLCSIILINFNINSYYFQSIVYYSIGSNYLNISYSFGLDGLSIFFFYLSSFLIFCCVLFVWDEKLLKEYLIILLVLDLLLLLVFSVFFSKEY
jgi:NADH:ubiquinone oxidoreductase subunit 4 (subunit M)